MILTGCKEEVAHYGIEAKGPSFDTLQEMEDYSSTIVCLCNARKYRNAYSQSIPWRNGYWIYILTSKNQRNF